MGLQTTSIVYKNTLFRYFYLYNYRPLSAGKDKLSCSLLKFKRGARPDLYDWIDCSLQELGPGTFSPDTIILRALHHNETKISEEKSTSLDLLGLSLARYFHCHYSPNLLYKSHPTRSNRELSREQRSTELLDVYKVDPQYLPYLSPVKPPSFLLIDDILTTGSTMRMMIRALRQKIPQCHIQIYTLARAIFETTPPAPPGA